MLQKRKAFTMLEAIMVIVVMGIIAAVAIPRLENDTTQEASDQILSDIRYAQHLALTDDVTNPANANWQRAFWSIRFQNQGGRWLYTIGSDKNLGGNIDKNEAAIDPLSGLPLYGNNTADDASVSPHIKIFKKSITNIAFEGCGQTIGFDRLGRPHSGFNDLSSPDYSSRLAGVCTITFTHPNGNFTIQINPETGYAFRTDQPNM